MKTIEIYRGRDEEMEIRMLIKGLNLPHGCLVTTTVRYSSSIATTSDFIHGYNFDEDCGEFTKLETLLDAATQEGKDTIETIKKFWKEI